LAFTTDRTSIERALAVAVQLCGEAQSVEASLTRAALTSTIFRKLMPHLGPEVTRPVPSANARELISAEAAIVRPRERRAGRRAGGRGSGPGHAGGARRQAGSAARYRSHSPAF